MTATEEVKDVMSLLCMFGYTLMHASHQDGTLCCADMAERHALSLCTETMRQGNPELGNVLRLPPAVQGMQNINVHPCHSKGDGTQRELFCIVNL